MRAYLIPLRYNISAALALFLLFTAQTVLAGTAQPLEGPACPCSGEKRQVAEPIGTYENSSPDLAPYDPCYDGIDNDSQSGVDWVDKDQDGKNDAEGDPDCVAPGKKMDLLVFDVPHYRELFYSPSLDPLEMVVKEGEILLKNGELLY